MYQVRDYFKVCHLRVKMKYQYFSNITFLMFWADIARFLQYFRNLSNSFINILAILQDFNRIFLKYSLNITVLCGAFFCCNYESIVCIAPQLVTKITSGLHSSTWIDYGPRWMQLLFQQCLDSWSIPTWSR